MPDRRAGPRPGPSPGGRPGRSPGRNPSRSPSRSRAQKTDAWGWDREASDAAFASVGDRVADEVGRLIRIWPQIQRSVYAVDGAELTLAQVDALAVLCSDESLRMSDVAKHLGVDPSTASRTIAPLVDLGLAVRKTARTDRRAVVVRASERGRATHARFAALRQTLMREIIGRMEPSRRVLLADLLEEFRAAHEERMPVVVGSPPRTKR